MQISTALGRVVGETKVVLRVMFFRRCLAFATKTAWLTHAEAELEKHQLE